MHAPLIVDRLRPLTINPASHPRGQPHLSAASGLVCTHGRAYVIGDDEHHLAIYRDRTSDAELQRLVGGDPPSGKAARKRRKPDFESLLWLPVDGALIALGSGSRPNRDRGVRLLLRHDGTPQPVSQPFDLAPVYEALRARLGAINIEGAFVVGDRLHLLNRGHAAAAGNVAVCYRLRDFIDLIDGSNSAVEPLSMQAFELGTIGGVALGFTDAAALPGGGWVFSAVAEDNASSYADGACRGAALGIVAPDGRLQSLRRLALPDKIEGIDAQRQADAVVLFMVTDADDPKQASWLLSARL